MKKLNVLLLFATLIITSNCSIIKARVSEKLITEIKDQLIKMDDIFDGRFPEFTINGKYKYRDKVNWFSGFTGGELWNLYDLTGDKELKKRALKHADTLLAFASIDYTHDMGFIFLPTVVEAYKRTGEKKYKDAGLLAAEMLAKRFNPNGNYIRAWGKLGSQNKAGLLIIDTMMNLELLFWAWQETGNTKFYDIAYKHAVICMEQSVRSDYSSYHVVEFDPVDGNVIKRFTHQGAKDESTWARGQAWGIYGFANAYKYTEDERFLRISQKMADVFLARLPNDFVPYWDLDLKGDDVVRDASAGVIAASGMYLLSNSCKYKNDYDKYKSAANKISESIFNNYTFKNSQKENEEGLLIHTVYNFHKGWGVDESYPCGDFYFTETLKKYVEEEQKQIIETKNLRDKILLNENWFYLEDNMTGINKLHLSSSTWQKINLPHSWNKFDAVDAEPGYRRDASWYQKEIILKEPDKSKKYKLYFEGSNITTEVYVNNKYAGKHVGGYVGFEIDITDQIKKGKNSFLVRVDNSINKEIIPSQISDFFIYGGITRDVWIKIVPKTNISRLNISTPLVNFEKSSTEINIDIDADNSSDADLLAELIDPNGDKVLEEKHDLNIKSGRSDYTVKLKEISNPILWSVDNPNLYTVKLTLIINDEIVDKTDAQFGYRWFEFKEHGAFYLNGEKLLLRGTHRHEEHAGLANALSNDQHRNDMKMIKDMGANFVRLAHYPQDPEVYKACNEFGILVWDELPWCRGGVGNEKWKTTAKQLFKEMIYQNYNHPSIILWSVGNEVYWLPEFEGGGDIDNLRSFTKELYELAHNLDPYRLTSIRKFYEGADIVDVFSPSIWAGWYSGVYTNYGIAIADAQKKYPRFFHAEYGGSSHIGRHTENPITGEGFVNPDEWTEAVNQVKVNNIAKIGDWSENYIVDLFDWHLRFSETSGTFTGNAQWAFKDFGTPLRPENAIPYMNQKGLVDRAGNPKDAYYVFKSYWNSDDKFTYIESHTWDERSGLEGKKREVAVYSNCSSVELFLNGKSLSEKKKDIMRFPASGLSWDVDFIDGENILTTVGYENNNRVAQDTMKLVYHYSQNKKTEKFVLSSERLENSNYLITAIAVDKDGARCLDYNERVYFSVEGKGKLLENYGVPKKSSIIEMANGKAQIEFKAVPFEKSTIEIRNQNFKGDYFAIDGLKCDK
ncbi:MAG: glycoside hydrolase family 88 protein [Melioribacteraceae bacterium]|nr:glycoside hydrolase family 88 protein [Melioribacteraceae bacterium]